MSFKVVLIAKQCAFKDPTARARAIRSTAVVVEALQNFLSHALVKVLAGFVSIQYRAKCVGGNHSSWGSYFFVSGIAR